jgi:hypothetical protein
MEGNETICCDICKEIMGDEYDIEIEFCLCCWPYCKNIVCKACE